MDIVILAEEPFPSGMAATNRMLSLARGFVEHGARVKVVLLRSHEKEGMPARNPQYVGMVNGVHYEYASGTVYSAGRYLMRRYLRCRAFVRASRIISAISRHPGQKVLIPYLWRPLELCYFYVLSRLTGFTMVQDKSEYPFIHTDAGRLGRILGGLYARWMYKLFDGLIVMTLPLQDYFRPRLRHPANILHVPMTVEVERFGRNNGKRVVRSPYIAYCGFLGGTKDGVPILLHAFSRIARKYPDHRLMIIGDASDPGDLISLQSLAGELGISERVTFTGRVHRDEIPSYLLGASLLVLSRPSGMQSDGGFPTKLGEYLATGNPVVVTAVGTIPDYLRDGENAFVAAPDSPDEFARKMDRALGDPDRARLVGKRGRDVALQHFDHRVQTERALSFLREIAK